MVLFRSVVISLCCRRIGVWVPFLSLLLLMLKFWWCCCCCLSVTFILYVCCQMRQMKQCCIMSGHRINSTVITVTNKNQAAASTNVQLLANWFVVRIMPVHIFLSLLFLFAFDLIHSQARKHARRTHFRIEY